MFFEWIERHSLLLGVLIFAFISIGGVVEVIPSFAENSRPIEGAKPYSALELAGRQIYIRESCNSCHSQLIRPFKAETDRYGAYSKSGEYAYDRPFLWGSRRTGPDLMRVGNYRSTDWHEAHFLNPTAVSPGSNMPPFPWFFDQNVDWGTVHAEMQTVKQVFGVPYDQGDNPKSAETEDGTHKLAMAEAAEVVNAMKTQSVKEAYEKGEIREVVAVIAYLNSMK
jgi:cytochrome c oxidase cbb3-type subunit 2